MSLGDIAATVDVAWLAANLGRPDLVVVDSTCDLIYPEGGGPYTPVSCRESYAAAHIPGAVLADLVSDFADCSSGLHFTVPSSQHFAQKAGALGIGNDATVIVYDQGRHFWASRFWWHLRLEGHDKVAVLEGGLPAWRAAGQPVTDAPTTPRPATFAPRRQPQLLARKSDVLAASASDKAMLINAMDLANFLGETRNYGRPGRIPGSKHLFFADLVDGERGALLPDEELASIFRATGALDPAKQVITYCGSGIAATWNALALARLGRHDVAVYDGSMSEWARDENLPMERG